MKYLTLVILSTISLFSCTNNKQLVTGDKVIWGDENNCRGIVLYQQQNLVKVKGYCTLGKINFLIEDYVSIHDLKPYKEER